MSNSRTEFIRKIERRMRRRNRGVNILTFIVALLLGFGLGIYLFRTGKLPAFFTEPVIGAPTVQVTPTAKAPAEADPFATEKAEETPAPTRTPKPKKTLKPKTTEETETETEQTPAPEAKAETQAEATAAPTVVPAAEATQKPTKKPKATAQPTPEATYQELKNKSKGDDVKALQQKLIDMGLLDDVADGVFGNNTKSAVMAFQKQAGLAQTGVADEETQRKLFAPAETPAPEAVETTPEPTATPEPVRLTMGSSFEAPDFCSLTLERYDFGRLIEPSAPDEDAMYSFFEAANDDMTYLYLTGTVTNIGAEELLPRSLHFKIATADAEYEGFAAYETADGKDLMAYGSLAASSTSKLLLVAEVPTTLEGSGGAIEATVTVNGLAAQITIR